MNRQSLKYFFLLLLFVSTQSFAKIDELRSNNVRKNINFNQGWKFHLAYDVRKQPEKINVTLPHTWNAKDVLLGNINYKRETGIYEKSFQVNTRWKDKRLFLYFEGANSVASVFVNCHFVAEHRGGYTAFCVEITNFVIPGTLNTIEIQVSNAIRNDVLPLCGDFNVYGGIHRPVSLLVTSKNCISPLDYASPGVYLTPKDISAASATIDILSKLSLSDAAKFEVRTEIRDADQCIVGSAEEGITDDRQSTQTIKIKKPHFWNGKTSPYLYTATIKLLKNNQLVDEVKQHLGIRYYQVDAEKGFSLNGKYLDLHGVGLHEDVQGKGSALDTDDYNKDMQLIKEIGANALRLTHYPHGKYFYDLCDKNGLIVWSEIPFVGPGGYSGDGYIKNEALEEQVKQVLTEMIRQNYNHPSILFWGLFNELKLDHDDPVPFLSQLNSLSKKEDPSRLTACASFLDNDRFNDVSDLIAWNKYYGWYDGEFKQIGTWADNTHRLFPGKPFAVSEYGAGGSPFKHTESDEKPVTDGKFHPEEWQTRYHEANWQELNKRSFIWAKFVWALADFGSSIRKEGDAAGINDKGLVTYDRSVKKDAFYFYKANWNNAPMLYITDRRNIDRHQSLTTIKIYSTVLNVQLIVNGAVLKSASPDQLHIIKWENIRLKKGLNKIEVRGGAGSNILEDSCEWTLK
ncbi:glycoside hydrolase family 2 protein [Mucilaginibacter sp. FT3.2]|uniref:glycoside hydrolase family 2 protein n=1 Tax=Mucilaginibacter sp. FT3.2 TaxID=2723090 RepID=UPI001607DBA2|nr:glycoside hydrolase family 2 TIM barrel-domain containing protein [Mucilaginibacter sp. FT3.2]MBB6234939.1 beta-galactosidase [Mucilaginibacter sp. FT3.2]